jgi:glycosyltransferase involved in cell wall biosynthesis
MFKTSETFIAAQAAALRRHEPVFIGRNAFGPAPVGARVVTPPPSKLTHARMVLLRDVGALRRRLAAEPVDLIHCHFAVDGVYAEPLARRLGLPLVVTLHGFDVTRSDASLIQSRRPALINAVLFRRALQRSGATFLCVSDFIRRAAVARGFPESDTRLHYLGIDTQKLAPDGTPDTPGLIVHVGRLVEKKGARYLIEALARMAADGKAAQLVIIGEGPLRADLEAQAGRLGVAERVRFMGALPHSETIGWMRRAAAVAVPSVTAKSGDEEGLPTVVLEAGALGRPVVAADAGGAAEAIDHGRTGYVLAQRDTAALADILGRLIDDDAARMAMGAAARAHMLEHFDMRRQTARLEDVYEAL